MYICDGVVRINEGEILDVIGTQHEHASARIVRPDVLLAFYDHHQGEWDTLVGDLMVQASSYEPRPDERKRRTLLQEQRSRLARALDPDQLSLGLIANVFLRHQRPLTDGPDIYQLADASAIRYGKFCLDLVGATARELFRQNQAMKIKEPDGRSRRERLYDFYFGPPRPLMDHDDSRCAAHTQRNGLIRNLEEQLSRVTQLRELASPVVRNTLLARDLPALPEQRTPVELSEPATV